MSKDKEDVYLGALDIKYAQPIPLTEEWLERFGFEKYNGDQFYKGDVRINMACDRTMIFYKDFIGDTQRLYLKDKYLHTFQNAMELIGEELKLKEDE